MKILVDQKDNSTVGIVVNEADYKITTMQDALSLIATVQEAAGTQKAVIFQDQLPNGFFDLSTDIANEILQKYVQYGFTIAIVGDFTPYDQSMQDFISNSNATKRCFFATNLMEALELLHAA